MIRQSSTPDMFCKHLLVYINSKVPFHEDLPPLPSHRSGVPGEIYVYTSTMLACIVWGVLCEFTYYCYIREFQGCLKVT